MSIDLIKSIYYEILSYFIPQKIKYKVEGSCNKCGNCCRQIRAYGLKTENEFKFMQLIFPLEWTVEGFFAIIIFRKLF